MVIGSIVAIFVLVWFYNTATQYGRNPLHWAVAGVMVYFIIALLWTVLITPDIKDAAMHNRNTLLMWITRYAYIIVALAGTVAFNLKVRGKKKED